MHSNNITTLNVYVDKELSQVWPIDAVRVMAGKDTVVKIICKGLKSGAIQLPEGNIEAPALKEYNSLHEYLKDYAPFLAKKIELIAKPLHDIEKDGFPSEIALMKKIPWPIQAHAATAIFKGIVKVLKKELNLRAFFMNCGDMGTGKTITALTVIHLLYHHLGALRVLLMPPGITIPQWINDEIKPTLPYAKIRVLRNWRDTLRFIQETRDKKPDGLEIVIIGRDRAKLGFDPWTCALWKRINGSTDYAWHCPDCFRPLPHPEEPDDYAGWDVLAAGVPLEARAGLVKGNVAWKKDDRLANQLKKCPYCKAVLRRPANKSRGETRLSPRFEPAWLMKRYLKKGHFDLMVVDEFHQFRGDSGRGASFASLACVSKIVLGLSGTPTTGKASSIVRILQRVCMSMLLEDGFQAGDVPSFVRTYGRLQEVTKIFASEGIHTRRGKERKTVKELPGIDPRVYVRYLFNSIFIEKPDLGIPLVEKREDVIFIELDKEHKEAYKDFHNRLDTACRRAVARGQKGAYAKFLPSVLNYAVLPRRYEVVIGQDEEDAEVIVSQDFPDSYISAPERRLLEEVEKEIKQGRRVMVYCTYTNKYGIDQRLHRVFTMHGIPSAVLKASIPDEERQGWIQDQVNKGIMVIISNMTLVEVGLNLISLPNMFFYQGNYQTEVVRQAGERGHRFGQMKACSVLHFVPNGTQCVPQFENMIASRAQAMYIEGRLIADELARYTDGFNALTRDVSKCLATSDVAQKWKELAAKDINIKTISEDKFKVELEKARKELVNLTLRLCGGHITSKEVQEAVRQMVAVQALSLERYQQLTRRQQKKVVPGQLFLDFGT